MTAWTPPPAPEPAWTAPPPPPKKRGRRPQVLFIAGAALAVGVVVAIIVAISGSGTSKLPRPGATDDSGKTLAITNLLAGSTGGGTGTAGRCVFAFNATVPSGLGFYGVTVTHRGTIKLPESQMLNPSLTLGS